MKKTLLLRLMLFFVASAVILSAAQAAAGVASPRERIRFDTNWRFHLGNDWGTAQNFAKAASSTGPAAVAFGDASWRQVNLPHDWAIELPFDKRADVSHGFRALGGAFPQNSVGWYRKVFDLPATDAGRRIWLEFDGVYRDSNVFVNGWAVAHQESGYSGFRVDITDVANCGGQNVVAVRVDATQNEGWFYEGAGIYRHVWLVKTGPVAIAPDGVFVYSDLQGLPEKPAATLHLETKVKNAEHTPISAKTVWDVADATGKTVAHADAEGTVNADEASTWTKTATLTQPRLWSPESPTLYTLHTRLLDQNGKVIDQIDTSFGVRSFAFDANKGFLLNGVPYVIKGTCNHQDHAGVGSALPDAIQDFRIKKLKELGSNAYRTSHNPPTPELLDACDRLGMIVMDENRLIGSDRERRKLLKDLILRDRNHASVAIWSLGNEEFSAGETPAGANVAATMQRLIKQLDATRPVTYNAPVGNSFAGINSVIEVRGWSYHIGVDSMDAYHAAHPQQPNVGSEQGSTVGTRGIYTADTERGYVTAYDDNAQPWSNTAEQWVTFFDSRPWLSGGFVWTGFDYRGEPTPYQWPCINSHFGIYDTCGFPKDNFYYYQSWWTNNPVLHILPHWNWKGREGQNIDVRVFSNCDEVELFLNGRSLGKKPMKRPSHLRWSVPFEAGALSAKGYRKGQLVAETKVETTEPAAALNLTADRATLSANGRDVAMITVAVKDKQGRIVPVANNKVSFTIEGAGHILGVGNGDPSCHEPDTYVPETTMEATSVSGWRWEQISDPWKKPLPEAQEQVNDSAWKQWDSNLASTLKKPVGPAVFRAHVSVSEPLLRADKVDLNFGKIDGDCVVYVNGTQVGNGAGSAGPTILDVTHALRAGDNAIAVVMNNDFTGAGPTAHAELRYPGKTTFPQWSRSTFNGFAQVIVESGTKEGVIKLTARAEGLEPAEVILKTARAE